MAAFSKFVLVAAIVWTVWRLLRIRARVRNTGIIIPPMVSATLVFAIFIILILATGLSPLHLLWLFPVSFVLGTLLIVFPICQKLVMRFLDVLGGLGSGVDR